MFLKTEKSTSPYPGPTNSLRLVVPQVPAGASTNAAGLSQFALPDATLAEARVRIDAGDKFGALIAVVGPRRIRRAIDREWRATVEGHEAVHLPSLGQDRHHVRTGNIVGDKSGEDVALVEIARYRSRP